MNNTTLLYVEDNLDIAEEILFFLKKKVKTVYLARDGQEGLEMFRAYNPMLIITDIQMPKLNGLDMIRMIRQENSEIPIIITSAFNETQMLLKAIESGVDSYLLKPIVLTELIQKVEKLIQPTILKNRLLGTNVKLKAMEKIAQQERELLVYKERMEYVFAGSNDGVFDWDMQSNAIYYSTKWKSIAGYKDEEIQNVFESFKQLIYPQDLLLVEETLQEAFASITKNYNVEFRQIHKDGHLVWILARGMIKYSEDGVALRVIGTHTDISKIKERERELKETKNSMKELLNEQNILLSLFDRSDTVIVKSRNDKLFTIDYISKSIETYLGYEVNFFKTLTNEYASCIHKDDLKKVVREVYESIKEDLDFFRHPEYRIITKDKQEKWVSNYTVAQRDADGKITHYIGYITDITELKVAQKRVEKLSITDELTQLYNRRHFNNVFAKELNRSQRDKRDMVLLMLDIDYFKSYNDYYGHIEGDNALVSVAQVLKTFTNRAGDNVFRLGGEEFGMIFFSDSLQNAQEYTKKLVLAVEKLEIAHEKSLVSHYMTISAGMAYKNHSDIISVDDLYKKADKALYRAKIMGRNQLKVNQEV